MWPNELRHYIARVDSLENITVDCNVWLNGKAYGHALISWKNTPIAFSYFLPFFYLAYLARRPRTYLTRLLFLPVVIGAIIQCTTYYRVQDPRMGWYDWVRALLGMALIAHSIYFAVIPEGVLKVNERMLRDPCDKEVRGAKASQTSSDERNSPDLLASLLPTGIYDALELGMTARGIGWQYGQGVHIPEPRRPLERKQYLKATFLSVMQVYLLVDFADSCIELLPGITPTSGSIYLPQLSTIPRIIVATFFNLLVGILVILGISMWYDLASLVGVGLLRQSPSSWPPFHDQPWRMDSLHEFWSKRWHQGVRHTFLVFGGYPGRWLAGDIGMLFGTFLASGFFHEGAFFLGGAPIDPKVVVFFAAQPVGILAEKFYRRYTGKRVGGWLGWTWAAIYILGLGQLCTNSWINRGAAGKYLVPPAISPARQLFLPWIRTLLDLLSRTISL